MKKIFLTLGILLCLGVCAWAGITFNSSTKPTNDEFENFTLAANTWEITVHYIKQVGGDAWSDATYTATYNPDYGQYGEITVKGMSYTVRKNMAYGQDRDGRAPYMYVAGDYYFNLN